MLCFKSAIIRVNGPFVSFLRNTDAGNGHRFYFFAGISLMGTFPEFQNAAYLIARKLTEFYRERIIEVCTTPRTAPITFMYVLTTNQSF